MRVKINLVKWAFAAILFFLFACLSAFAGVVTEPVEQVTVLSFFSDHWAEIGLLLSEAAAFLPKKFSGIIKTIISFAGMLLAKKKSS
jgi:hypothetical protein